MTTKIKNIALIISLMITSVIIAQPTIDNYQVVEVAGLHESLNYQFVQNQDLYRDGWDKL